MKRAFVLMVSLLLAAGLALTLTGCKSISPISLEEFTEKAEAAEYTVKTDDNTALADNGHEYVISFIVYGTAADAQAAYNQAKEGLPSSGSYTSVNLPAYSYEKMTSGGKYYVIYRVGATFLAVTADSGYKTEINNFLKSIGY